MSIKLPPKISRLVDDEAKDRRLAIQYYNSDFVHGKPCKVQGYTVVCDNESDPETAYPNTFIHLTSKEARRGMDDREYDKVRTSVLPWCYAVLSCYEDDDVIVFDHDDGHDKGIRTYLWVKSECYIIIIKKKQAKGIDGAAKLRAHLITAYLLDDDGTKRMERKYGRREKI